MKEKIIKIAVVVAALAAAGVFYLKSNEGEDISSLRDAEFAMEETAERGGAAASVKAEEVTVQSAVDDASDPGPDRTAGAVDTSYTDVPAGDTSFADGTQAQTAPAGTGTGTAAILEETAVVDDGRIDINTADTQQLKTLSGIGDVKAKKIIEYRQTNGKFETIEDIKNVNGIGDATFAKIRDSIKI